ncbi:hypothetical protein NJ7G_0100 [Natrinema sp. J7-2]|nr:hypothetical protein NJ7G_0100 [Natrinema sp. J7-2]
MEPYSDLNDGSHSPGANEVSDPERLPVVQIRVGPLLVTSELLGDASVLL